MAGHRKTLPTRRTLKLWTFVVIPWPAFHVYTESIPTKRAVQTCHNIT